MNMAPWVGHNDIFVYKRNNRYDSNSRILDRIVLGV